MFTPACYIVFGCLLAYLPGCLSQTLMLATESGIQTLQVDSGVLTTVLEQNVSAVDFRIVHNELYFISENIVYYSYFSQYENERPDPIPIFKTNNTLGHITIDWVKYTLYYSVDHAVYKSGLLGPAHGERKVWGGLDVRGMAIDPYMRTLFILSANSLSSCNTDGDGIDSIPLSKIPLIDTVTSIAVDHYYKQVYLIGIGQDESPWLMLRSDYHLRKFDVILTGEQLEGSRVMDVFRGQVIWANHNHTLYSLFADQTGENVTTLWQSNEPIQSVRFFSRLAQAPNTSVACQARYCSDCVEVTRYSIACESDQELCTEKRRILCPLQPYILILFAILESLLQKLSSLPSIIRLFVYICCGLMTVLLIFGFCMLLCIPKPKKAKEVEEIYSMS